MVCICAPATERAATTTMAMTATGNADVPHHGAHLRGNGVRVEKGDNNLIQAVARRSPSQVDRERQAKGQGQPTRIMILRCVRARYSPRPSAAASVKRVISAAAMIYSAGLERQPGAWFVFDGQELVVEFLEGRIGIHIGK